MKIKEHSKSGFSGGIFTVFAIILAILLNSCSSFNYKTYNEKGNEDVDDPEPDYNRTLDKDFQDYTNYMFIGNRIENFGTFFNTYYNAKENFDEAYDDYIVKVLANYGNHIDSIYAPVQLSQQSIDLFNKCIEKSSRILQYHRSSAFLDRAVLLVAKSYYYLGDYVKAERKFGEFVSKLSVSRLADENLLYYSKTQLRLGNSVSALEKLQGLIKNSSSNSVRADAYQTLAEYDLSKKDYQGAIVNFKKAIEYSKDSEFKAQMQFLLATVIAQTDYKLAAKEFDKVTDFNASFDLEFYSRLNRLKYLILANDYRTAEPMFDLLRVKYKEFPEFVAQVEFLQANYYEQKKDLKNSMEGYYQVIKDYPKTPSSSNASFQIAKYQENTKLDYLNAFKYYRFSTEESSAGKYYPEAVAKVKLLRKYFDLRSVISGIQINTDYDSMFYVKTQGKVYQGNNNEEQPGKKGDNGNGNKPGGEPGYTRLQENSIIIWTDSVQNSIDSARLRVEAVAKAKFELAELFDYDLKKSDSSEYYFKSAFEESGDYDFKSRVLYALSSLYKSKGDNTKAEEILRRIISEYPISPIINEVKYELNIPVDVQTSDESDSLFLYSESSFGRSDYPSALEGYRQLLKTFPSSIYSVKSAYSAGWIYENILMKSDSAYIYYSQIIFSNPKSEYAAAVSNKVKEYEDSKKIIINDTNKTPGMDSVKVTDTTKTGQVPEIKNDIKKIEEEPKLDNLPKKDEQQKPDVIKPDDVKDPKDKK